MNFKIDENLPVEVAELMRQSEHDAITVLDQNLGGSDDFNVALVCKREKRILVTMDMDFADIRTYPPDEFSGLIILRLKRQDKPYVLGIVERLMHLFLDEPIDGHLWIVEEGRVRIRG